MLISALVVAFAFAAAFTDFRWHKIYNWTTYPGMLTALVVHGLGSATGLALDPEHPLSQWVGWIGLADSVAGLVACGCLMIVLFVFFRIGGGDVKLLAMLGAFLGWEKGIETLLWTFVLGGAVGLTVLIWRVGLWTLVARSFRHFWSTLRFGYLSRLTEEERRELQVPLFLAPAALAAVVIVRFELLEYLDLRFQI
jgi:Flp pilus assembly protein protease CpaA